MRFNNPFTIPLLSFEGILPKEAPCFGLVYEAFTLSWWCYRNQCTIAHISGANSSTGTSVQLHISLVQILLPEPVYNCTYLWCKFFDVNSVEIYRISHDHLLNLIQTYLQGVTSQIIVYERYHYMYYIIL